MSEILGNLPPIDYSAALSYGVLLWAAVVAAIKTVGAAGAVMVGKAQLGF